MYSLCDGWQRGKIALILTVCSWTKGLHNNNFASTEAHRERGVVIGWISNQAWYVLPKAAYVGN